MTDTTCHLCITLSNGSRMLWSDYLKSIRAALNPTGEA